MMKKLSFHFLFVVLFIPNGTRAFELYRAGARSIALGNSGVTLTGPESLFHNPAGCAGVSNFSCILSSESRFLLKELSVLAAGVVIPVKAGAAGLSHIRFRAGAYHTGRTTVSFSRSFGDRISAAVAFDCLSERYPEQERLDFVFTAETGLQYKLNSRCLAGFWAFHPVPFRMNRDGVRQSLPTILRGGTSWILKNGLCLLDEIEYTPGGKPVISAGLEITIRPEIVLRIGWTSRPMNLSGGVGFTLGKTAIDFSFYHHGYLGITPVAGFTFNP